jgi:O-acetylserine/cysteine efflux transporter
MYLKKSFLMSPSHIFLAGLVGAIWGFNFVVVKWGLSEMPPLLFASLRFFLVSFPLIFFVKKPAAPFWIIAGIGLSFGFLKFVFLFTSLAIGTSAGLASLLCQMQIGFSLVLSWLVLKEKSTYRQTLGVCVAALGAISMSYLHDPLTASILGILFVLLSAFFWGMSNIFIKIAGPVDSFSLVIWSSAFAPLPHFILSYFFEGPSIMIESIKNITLWGYGALTYIVICATWIAGTAWSYLIRTYSPNHIAPYSLLVPVFALFSAWFFLNETLSASVMCAACLVFVGLLINQWPDSKSRTSF